MKSSLIILIMVGKGSTHGQIEGLKFSQHGNMIIDSDFDNRDDPYFESRSL